MGHLPATDKPRNTDLIYVVENDPDVSQLIEHNLRTAGYEVSTFSPERSWFPWQSGRCLHCFFSTSCCPGSTASICAVRYAIANG
jgi:DNA-binding NtrC family response regulator